MRRSFRTFADVVLAASLVPAFGMGGGTGWLERDQRQAPLPIADAVMACRQFVDVDASAMKFDVSRTSDLQR